MKHLGICEYCGKETLYKYKSWIKRFCSYTCSMQWKWENVRDRAKTRQIICQFCGKKFVKTLSFLKQHPDSKYCSRECMGKEKRTGSIVKCPICGNNFYTTRNIYCSKKCAASLKKVENPKWEFQKYKKDYQKKYQKKNRERINFLSRIRNKTTKGREEKARLRIQSRGQGYLSKAEHDKLLKKSQNICFWCQKEIVTKINIDHLIPVSKGGKTEIENLVVACAFCNQSKGNKLPDEFRRYQQNQK